MFYKSQAARSLDETDLQKIIGSCEKHNDHNLVTGLLVFDGTFFHQFIEGERTQVSSLMHRIKQDQRHQKIRIIGQKPATERVYLSWGFRWDEGNLIREMEEALRL